MSRLLLALVGYPGSGKTESGNYLAQKHGFAQYSDSNLIVDEAIKAGVELKTRADYVSFQRALRLKSGLSFIADRSLELPADRIVNVGMRNRYDIHKYREAGGILVALVCPDALRFERTAGTGPELDLRKAHISPGQIYLATNSFSSLDEPTGSSPSDKTVFTPLDISLEHAILRKSSQHPAGFTEFKAAEKDENNADLLGSHVAFAIAQSKHQIENTGSIHNLQQELDQIVSIYS
jgi:hypothetical protein